MSGWDEGQVFFSDQQWTEDEETVDLKHVAQRKFADFLRNFREYSADGAPIYMDMLDHDPPPSTIKVSLDDLHAHDKALASALRKAPAEYLPLVEVAASDIIASIRNKEDDTEAEQPKRYDVQVMLTSTEPPKSIRDLSANEVSKLVVLPGIVIAASRCKSKATTVTLICKTCKNTKTVACKPGLGGAVMPRVCDARINAPGEEACPLDPFTVLPDRSKYVDQQVLKLQESPEAVPTGELPRHMMVTVDRHMVQKITPGTRVTIVGIYLIFQQSDTRGKAGKAAVAIRQPYIRVVGIEECADGNSRGNSQFSAKEVADFSAFAAQPKPIEALRAKIAPAIFGSDNLKAAILCMLMGGARKLLPDGVRLRGDVNVLLLGDPSTAKSQFLKFVEKTAPIAVYTSGKGSSAAGLTATIVIDSQSREAYLEGGAMVLADGGVVCIDEFDKMRPEDRVAIHEAMEQQTISIAKAGITTVLNSRCAVLAAANPPSGHYDDMKSAAENIDLQTTILSRFDLIFIVKDDRNYKKDTELAQHVLRVHTNAAKTATPAEENLDAQSEGEFDLKRYIQFCRCRVSPRLTATAAEALGREYVKIRQEQRQRNESSTSGEAPNPIPITVRQLEAIIRISESLARCSLTADVTEEHVWEAIRLFNISTMDAARAGITEGQMTEDQRQELLHVETQIKRLLRVGGTIKERYLLEQISQQGINELSIRKALHGMAQRAEIEFQNERKNVRRLI